MKTDRQREMETEREREREIDLDRYRDIQRERERGAKGGGIHTDTDIDRAPSKMIDRDSICRETGGEIMLGREEDVLATRFKYCPS